MLSNLAKTLVLAMTLLPFASSADRGQYRNYKKIGDWYSTVFHVDNTDYIRIGTASRRASDTSFIVDYLGNKYLVQIIIVKTGNEIGHVTSPTPVPENCELRIDTNPVFYTKCTVNDDNLGMFVTFDASRLGSRFFDELKGGSVLRTRLGQDSSSVYDNYSLRGFSRTYQRARSLAVSSGNLSDSDYFR